MEAECLRVLAAFKGTRGQFDQAKKDVQHAQSLYEQFIDKDQGRLGVAHCLRILADINKDEHPFRQDAEYYERALKAYEDAERTAEQMTTKNLCSEELVPRSEQIIRGKANCIQCIGFLLPRKPSSFYDDAQRRYDEAKNLYEMIGDDLGVADCVKGNADVLSAYSQHDWARILYKEAQNIYKACRFIRWEADCIYRMGDLELKQGHIEGARILYDEAQQYYARCKWEHGMANCAYSLGGVYLIGREYDEAERQYQGALMCYERLSDDLGWANCSMGLADIINAKGNRSRYRREQRKVNTQLRKYFSPETPRPSIKEKGFLSKRWRW